MLSFDACIDLTVRTMPGKLPAGCGRPDALDRRSAAQGGVNLREGGTVTRRDAGCGYSRQVLAVSRKMASELSCGSHRYDDPLGADGGLGPVRPGLRCACSLLRHPMQ